MILLLISHGHQPCSVLMQHADEVNIELPIIWTRQALVQWKERVRKSRTDDVSFSEMLVSSADGIWTRN